MAKFYGIGTGPGNSDLLTIRGKEILEKADCLYAPEPKKGGKSLALKIAAPYLRESLAIKQRHFPMVNDWSKKQDAWDKIAGEIIADVKSGKNTAFITLGDPMTYSTYCYLLERVSNEIETETVAGISSFAQIANRLQIPLVMDEESYAVMPASAPDTVLQNALINFDTVILMKVSIALPKILRLLKEEKLLEQAVLVSDVSMDSEKIVTGLGKLEEGVKLSYFSTIAVFKNRKIKEEK